MKNHFPKIALLFLLSLVVTSCDLVGDIFQAGMGVGIFIVVAIIAVIIFIVAKLGGRNKS